MFVSTDPCLGDKVEMHILLDSNVCRQYVSPCLLFSSLIQLRDCHAICFSKS